MARWSQYDEDSYRLPEGTTRVGYDADTQTYTYKDSSDGSLWEGPAGSRYGKLTRVSDGGASRLEVDEMEVGMEELVHDRDEAQAWRALAPFLLLVGLVLVLVFWFVRRGG